MIINRFGGGESLESKTSDANAIENDMLVGKTAYVQGKRITGNIEIKSLSNLTINDANVAISSGYYPQEEINIENLGVPTQEAITITPSINEQIAVAQDTYTTGDITVAGELNLKPENIVNGVSIFGVTGTATQVIASTEDVIEGAESPYPEGSLYVVYDTTEE